MSLDRLFVSLAFAPDGRVPVGILSQSGRDSLFQFDESFLASPLPLSPLRLPVRPGVQAYDGRGGMETFGVFEDALPDGWGRRIVDARFRKRHGRLPTLLERFASLGGDGMGALVFEPAEPPAAEAAEDFRLDALARNAWDFDGGRIEAGEHTLEITFFGNRFNTFGPLHSLCDRKYIWNGEWRTRGDDWCYEYNLNPTGIMDSPEIIVKN